MRRLRRFLIRLAASATRRADEERLKEEIEEYLDRRTEENIRAGLPAVEARRQAALKFGAVEAVKERYRDTQRLPLLEVLLRDLRYTLRQLRKAPVFTVTAALSLAVGIGANAAVFTLVDRVLLRSLPVSHPEELVFVTDQRIRQQPSPRFSYPFYTLLKDNDVLQGVSARFSLSVNAAMHDQVARVSGELVSGNYFSVIGAGTQIGRPLSAEDDRTPGSHPVAVISGGFWQRSYASDPSVIGRGIRINNHTFTIIGVAANGFTGTEVGRPTDVWLPMMMQREMGRDLLNEVRTNWIEIIGRMKPGVSLERAGDELAAYLEGRTPVAQPAQDTQSRRVILVPGDKGNSPVRRELGPALRMLMVLTVLALVLACVNVASLLVVRSIAREKEIAVRLALGARRSSLIRQFLTETAVLAALGGTAGLLMAPWAAGLLLAAQRDALGIDATLDVRVFIFAFAVCVLTAVVVGLAPILASRKVGFLRIRGNYRPVTSRTYGRVTLRDVLVTGQIAVSLIILIGAGLFVQSLRNLTSVETGFQAENVLLISVDPASAGYDAGRVEGFWRDTLVRLSEVRGVKSVSLAGTVPLAPGRQRQPLFNPTSDGVVEIDTNFVGPQYFRTLGVTVVSGRDFSDQDGQTSVPVVIVNERLARLFWPDQDPIGKSLRVGPANRAMAEVVGVVRDVKYRDLRDDPVPMLYAPAFQRRSRDAMTLHVRTATDHRELAGTIRRELQILDPNLPAFAIRTLEDQLNAFLAQPRQVATLTTGFGILALLLSGIGVYGVTAFAVSRQTHDIGIRMALGAGSRQIVHVVGRRGLTLMIAGLGLGLLGSVGFAEIAAALLFGVAASDTTTFVAMCALLAGVSLTAIYIPARAATRLDAISAIRCD